MFPLLLQVVLGGSGHRAGLKEGDLVIEVNGQGMEDKYIEDVIMLVKEGGHFLSLLVMEKSDSSEQKNTQQTTEAETEKYDSQVKLKIKRSFFSLLSIHFGIISMMLCGFSLYRRKKLKSYYSCSR